jgi:hypothetical protein
VWPQFNKIRTIQTGLDMVSTALTVSRLPVALNQNRPLLSHSAFYGVAVRRGNVKKLCNKHP